MGFELKKAAARAQRATVAAAPGSASAKYGKALALVKQNNCRSLYALRGMSFSQFTNQQNITIATSLLTRALRWFSAVGNKMPTLTNYFEFRFIVDTFMKIAEDSGALMLFGSVASPITLSSNASAQQIKGAIKLLKIELQKGRQMVPPKYAPVITKLNGALDSLVKSPYLVPGWMWLNASESFLKSNLVHCK